MRNPPSMPAAVPMASRNRELLVPHWAWILLAVALLLGAFTA
jgi:hypothetical protein